jgi:Leucine-rich repeat (LRR) protein
MQLNNLTELDCSNTSLSDHSIKYLINLSTLICKNNIDITYNSIKYLTNLVKLNCVGSGIKKINDNKKLKYLDCSFQNIFEIDLESNITLEELCCQETNIRELKNLQIFE